MWPVCLVKVSEAEAQSSWIDQYDSAAMQCSHAYW